jgi:hypothetical protein
VAPASQTATSGSGGRRPCELFAGDAFYLLPLASVVEKSLEFFNRFQYHDSHGARVQFDVGPCKRDTILKHSNCNSNLEQIKLDN